MISDKFNRFGDVFFDFFEMNSESYWYWLILDTHNSTPMNYENCVGIQFPPTPTTTFARSIPRIQPNQQSARYTSRTKLATLAIWEEEKKKSKDKTQELLAPPRLGGFRNVESLGTPAPSVAPGQEEIMEVDDADELNALGLPVSEPNK